MKSGIPPEGLGAKIAEIGKDRGKRKLVKPQSFHFIGTYAHAYESDLNAVVINSCLLGDGHEWPLKALRGSQPLLTLTAYIFAA